MALLDVTIVNIAMPAIITDLDTTVADASWVLNSYSLVLAVFFLSMGRVADKYGQKRVFIFGLVTFTLFSLLCGLAPNIAWLVAFRAGQGLGGAALLTISLAIVLGAFPRRQQGTAVGLWGALGTAAAAVGPALGGVLVSYGHWSWIFFVNIPIGIVAVIACALIIPRSRPHATEGGLDIPGMLISGAGLFCLTLALVEGDAWGWTSGSIVALFVAAAVELPAVHVVGDTHRVADVPREPAAHPLVHGREHRRHVHRPRDGRHLPHARDLPRLGAGLLRAARRTGDHDHAGAGAHRRPQRRTPERPHRTSTPRCRGGRLLRDRPDACWPSSAATRSSGTSCGGRRSWVWAWASPCRPSRRPPWRPCRLRCAASAPDRSTRCAKWASRRRRRGGRRLLAHRGAERAAGHTGGRRTHRRFAAARPGGEGRVHARSSGTRRPRPAAAAARRR